MDRHVHIGVLNCGTDLQVRAAFRKLLQRAYAEYPLAPFHRPYDSVIAYDLCARIDDQLVGYGVIECPRDRRDRYDCDNIPEIYVVPEHRRHGIGSVLLQTLETFSESGVITVQTRPAGEDKFFIQKNGYETNGPRGVIFLEDRQWHWKVTDETLARWHQEKSDEYALRAAQSKRFDDWQQENWRRLDGGGKPGRSLLTSQLLPSDSRFMARRPT